MFKIASKILVAGVLISWATIFRVGCVANTRRSSVWNLVCRILTWVLDLWKISVPSPVFLTHYAYGCACCTVQPLSLEVSYVHSNIIYTHFLALFQLLDPGNVGSTLHRNGEYVEDEDRMLSQKLWIFINTNMGMSNLATPNSIRQQNIFNPEADTSEILIYQWLRQIFSSQEM